MHPTYLRYAERIRQIAPDLTVETVSVNDEGLVNDVLIVNGQTLPCA